MADDAMRAEEVWLRYQFMRDNGHLDYVIKAKKCEDFFAGLQWDKADLEQLRSVKRPALTINKIIATLSNVMGEQIFNRAETSYRPRNEGSSNEIADALTKVFMQISDNNQLDWVRSDVFADGVITSRGFYDARLEFTDSMRGEVSITQENPKNILVDPDAEDYDPQKWGDVIKTKWLSHNDIALTYSKEAADSLKGRDNSYWPYGYDSVDRERDRFGIARSFDYGYNQTTSELSRNYRIIERQWRKLDMVKHFVDLKTGDLRVIPTDWDRNRIAMMTQRYNLGVITKRIKRIRWTVVADNLVLHDDWSPYKNFTIVPYFPYFRRGNTVGLVENLLGPQELLNKVSSQELHVVNTTANSGWKLKKGNLTNMTVEELEQRGSQTGIVLELVDMDGAEKITPNQTPSGLDRISFKAEDHIKSISGVSDSMLGFDREDVAARAIEAKQARGTTNLAKVMDNLLRSDNILAKVTLDLVQQFYSEERVLFITKDRLTGEREQLTVNQVNEEGEITNDLTLGEYAVVTTSQPVRDTFEDSQFDQALGLFEKGVPIPPDVLVESSRLKNKAEIVKQMRGDTESPEAQRKQQLQARGEEAATQKLEAEAVNVQTDSKLKAAKAQKEMESGGMGAQEEFVAEKYKIDREMEFQRWKTEEEIKLKRYQIEEELKIKKMEAEAKAEQQKKDEFLKRATALHGASTIQ